MFSRPAFGGGSSEFGAFYSGYPAGGVFVAAQGGVSHGAVPWGAVGVCHAAGPGEALPAGGVDGQEGVGLCDLPGRGSGLGAGEEQEHGEALAPRAGGPGADLPHRPFPGGDGVDLFAGACLLGGRGAGEGLGSAPQGAHPPGPLGGARLDPQGAQKAGQEGPAQVRPAQRGEPGIDGQAHGQARARLRTQPPGRGSDGGRAEGPGVFHTPGQF